ncbi:MAG: hypothetical protein ACOYNC_05405 [Bacteroidales bacterium]
MKKTAFVLATICFSTFLVLSACTKKKTAAPCDGLGILNVENKLDSTLSVKITETHNTTSIEKDYTMPFSLPGDQPYTLSIDGPQYHKDTTLMILNCDNMLFIVQK